MALYRDLLIHVTSFFRDPEVFRALRNKILPQIVARKQPGESIRIRVPGCSTGEEAYSIAICLFERLKDEAPATPIQIFASDISESEIDGVIYQPDRRDRSEAGRVEYLHCAVPGASHEQAVRSSLKKYALQLIEIRNAFERLNSLSIDYFDGFRAQT